MKKVLILTCSTGEGHNSAARAIEAAMKKKGIVCEIKDPVSFKSEKARRIVASLYNETIRRAPAVFGAVYKLGDLYSASRLPSPVYWANAHYAQRLKEYIHENGFDVVVCTHLYGMEAVTALRRQGEFSVPCYGVLTDYVCIPFIDETVLTKLFVPTEETRQYLIQKGIPKEQIVLSGIPVNERFKNPPDRHTARHQLGILEEKKVFLTMTGGVGCENMEKLCGRLFAKLTDRDMLIVLTGKNDVLRKRLDDRFQPDSRIKTVGFTDQVATYMAAADVLLSKPGGLSSTEAAVANVPLVHIHGIPGCESYNVKYFSSHGMSLNAQNDDQAVECAMALAYDREMAEHMRRMQRKYIHPDAAEQIVKEVVGI